MTCRKYLFKFRSFVYHNIFKSPKATTADICFKGKGIQNTFCNLVTSIKKKVSSHTEINIDLGDFNITHSEVYLKDKKKVLFSPLKKSIYAMHY